MDVKWIESLAKLMKENGLTALEYSKDGASLKLERRGEALPPAVPASAAAAAVSPFVSAPVEPEAAPKKGALVLSPTVGVFYAAPSPESKPYVEVGSKVRQGDTLCIIEAMKMMNEIPSEVDGTVVEVCVGNGQVVEYNQPLFRIEP